MSFDVLAEAGSDLAHCHRLLCDGSRSFLAASRLLPRGIARAACSLYAFCRVADDSVDLAGGAAGGAPGAGRDVLAALRARLDGVYAGNPRPIAADRAFAAVVAHYRIPKAWPLALLEGFEWDVRNRGYEDAAELRAYAARVAGSVGAMMARVMGVQGGAALARACELGVAMQLTNIARDVGADAAMGRLYLPRSWMREAGIDPDDWLRAPAFTPALGRVVQRILAEADLHYRGGAAGVPSLPPGCRPGIRAAALLYADIGRSIGRQGYDSVSARATVGAARKLQLVGCAAVGDLTGTLLSRRRAMAEPPPEIGFLLDAAGPPLREPVGESSVLVVLQMFERLERRDRQVAAAPAMTI